MNYLQSRNDRGIAFDDQELGIDWILSEQELKLSDKDRVQPSFVTADYFDFNESLYV